MFVGAGRKARSEERFSILFRISMVHGIWSSLPSLQNRFSVIKRLNSSSCSPVLISITPYAGPERRNPSHRLTSIRPGIPSTEKIDGLLDRCRVSFINASDARTTILLELADSGIESVPYPRSLLTEVNEAVPSPISSGSGRGILFSGSAGHDTSASSP